MRMFTKTDLLDPGGGALSAHSLANRSMLLIRCIKAAKMRLTFHIYPLRRDFIENFEIFFWGGGTPILAPWKCGVPKMSTPGLPITPLFYCIILFYYKNGDVCKKLEPKRLRFDRDIRVLSLEKIEPKFLKKFVCGQKNAVNQRVFKILLIFLPH